MDQAEPQPVQPNIQKKPRIRRETAIRIGLSSALGLAFFGACRLPPMETPSAPMISPADPNSAQRAIGDVLKSVSSPEAASSARLYIENGVFKESESEIILKGAVTNHGVYDTDLSYYDSDIDWLAQNGANFVVVQWNSGFLHRPGYVEKVVQMAERAKAKGLRVELTLHSRGLKPNSDWDPQQIQVVDDQITADWDSLLSNPAIATRLGNAVDIFSPLSEPNFSDSGDQTPITWDQWRPIAEATAESIRLKIGTNPVIAVSGIGYGSNITDCLNNPPNIDNYAIESHWYTHFGETRNFTKDAEAAQQKGIALFVGEMGHSEPREEVRGQYEFLHARGLGFATYGLNSSSDYEFNLRPLGTPSPTGQLATDYFR